MAVKSKKASRKNLLEKYGYVGSFREGLAAVLDGIGEGVHFHILPNGKPAYEERYECALDFYEGLAVAKKDGKYFHILPNGKPAYEERYDRVGPFKKGRAWVKKGDECFFILPNGEKIGRAHV